MPFGRVPIDKFILSRTITMQTDSHAPGQLNPTAQTNRKLLNACEKVSQNWFPVNKSQLNKICEGLKQGVYDLDLEFLISEIKTDFALYSLCLKEIKGQSLQKGGEVLTHSDDLFKLAGQKRIAEIVVQIATQESAFPLEEATAEQLHRFRETLICTSSAEVLADHRNIPREDGYASAFLRQLGLNLVAWNYPEQYRKALTSRKAEERLEDELTKLLGFSPNLLALSVTKDWGLPKQVLAAAGKEQDLDNLSEPDKKAFKSAAENLTKLCEISEAFARSNHPEYYPSAMNDWGYANTELHEILGDNAFSLIQEQIKQNSLGYLKVSPQHFRILLKKNPEKSIQDAASPKLFRQNKYIKHCAPSTQTALFELYQQLEQSYGISREAITNLTRKIIPDAGFGNGCVFLLELSEMHLVPSLKIGKFPMDRAKKYHALSMQTRSTNPVTSAYHCNTPIIESNFTLSDQGSSCIAVVLGIKQRVGVLYLEPDSSLLEAKDSTPLLRFKAMSQALHDCLALT